MGLLLPGGNREFEAEDVGDQEEGFTVCGEEKIDVLKLLLGREEPDLANALQYNYSLFYVI